MNSVSPLINAEELDALIQSKGALAVVDASWHLPNVQRNAFEEFEQQRIPGAVFFDIDTIVDPETDLPHMLPSAAEFSQAVSLLGISSDDQVVVYDSVGLFSAARVWWMFTVFGHKNVSVLDGGLPAWKALSKPMEHGELKPKPSVKPMAANLSHQAVCSWQEVLQATDQKSARILDARPKARFDAAVPEPRKGLRSGHMPSAISLPFTELLKAESDEVMRLKPAEELAGIFKARGVTDGADVITTCGSGVTAAIITLALHVAGYEAGRLYDGSWSEWGALEHTPVV